MKLNLGTKPAAEDISVEDLEALELECTAACEAAFEAGYECKEMETVLQNVQFASRTIATNGIEWYIENCDNTNELGQVLGKSTEDLTADVAIEGLKEIANKAWEKIKAFFKRIWEWVVRVYEKITGTINEKRLRQIQENLKQVKSDAPFKVERSSGKVKVSYNALKEMVGIHKEMKKKYDSYAKDLDAHLKKVKDVLSSNKANQLMEVDKLKDNAEKLKKQVGELRDLSEKLKSVKTKDSDKWTSTNSVSLFFMGFNVRNYVNIFQWIREVQSDMKDVKDKEAQLNKLKDEITKIGDGLSVYAGKEDFNLDPYDNIEHAREDAVWHSGRRAVGYSVVAIVPALLIPAGAVSGAIGIMGAVAISLTCLYKSLGWLWACLSLSGKAGNVNEAFEKAWELKESGN